MSATPMSDERFYTLANKISRGDGLSDEECGEVLTELSRLHGELAAERDRNNACIIRLHAELVVARRDHALSGVEQFKSLCTSQAEKIRQLEAELAARPSGEPVPWLPSSDISNLRTMLNSLEEDDTVGPAGRVALAMLIKKLAPPPTLQVVVDRGELFTLYRHAGKEAIVTNRPGTFMEWRWMRCDVSRWSNGWMLRDAAERAAAAWVSGRESTP